MHGGGGGDRDRGRRRGRGRWGAGAGGGTPATKDKEGLMTPSRQGGFDDSDNLHVVAPPHPSRVLSHAPPPQVTQASFMSWHGMARGFASHGTIHALNSHGTAHSYQSWYRALISVTVPCTHISHGTVHSYQSRYHALISVTAPTTKPPSPGTLLTAPACPWTHTHPPLLASCSLCATQRTPARGWVGRGGGG